MSITIVSPIVNFFCWMAFIFGIPFNAILILLIARHTPQQMAIYSKILLQTCVVDILLLIMTLLFTPYNYMTANGEKEAIVYGLVTIKGVETRIWNALAFVSWVFLVYVSMFGYVSQFIFRYFVVVCDMNLSATKYFLLLFLMLLFPFAYCANMFFAYFHFGFCIMEDKSVAEILGLNLSDQIPVATHAINDLRQTLGLCYVIIVSTIAYIIIFMLAYRIQKVLENKAKNSAFFGATKQMIEMNRQVSRNLIVQASMPLTIYLTILFLLARFLFKNYTKHWSWLQYYDLVATIPLVVPSAFNPIVPIYVLQYYRNAFVSDLKYLVKHGKRIFFCQHPLDNERQQNEQQKKWAIIVTHSLKRIGSNEREILN